MRVREQVCHKLGVLVTCLAGFFISPASTIGQAQPGWRGVPGLAEGRKKEAVRAMAEFDDGVGPFLYIGGNFETIDNQIVNGVAKGDGLSWSPVGVGLTGTLAGQEPRVDCLKVLDFGDGPTLYAGGDFQFADSVEVNGLAKWDGISWQALGPGLAPSETGKLRVYDLCVYDDGTGPNLFVGGWFRTPGEEPAIALAKWDGSEWSAVGDELQSWMGLEPIVGALCVFDDGRGPALYVGGMFEGAGEVDALNVARWDGVVWEPVGGGLPQYSSNLLIVPFVSKLTILDDGTGDALYATGAIEDTTIGTTWSSVAKWSGSAWTGFAYLNGYGDIQACVSDITMFDDGTGPALFATGLFESLATKGDKPLPLNGVAKFQDGIVSAVGSGLSSSTGSRWQPWGKVLHVFDDGFGDALFFGGEFVGAGGHPAMSLARWGLLPADMNCDGRVDSLDIDPFVLAITDPTAYGNTYPYCSIGLADLNRDGEVSELDITSFVERLTSF